jgi:prepilin-type processing-associated H-X9-DG protein
MAASAIGFFPILLTLLLGGGGLPLSLPPLPEDPVLARVAPKECLVYMNFSGMATPDAKSKNQTEQLLAEPEVQEMFRGLERAILGPAEKHSPPQQAAIFRETVRWTKKLLTRPVAAFVSSVAISNEGPDIRAGVVINAGEDAAEAKAALEKYQAAFFHGAPEKVEIGGISCYRFKLAPTVPSITWGIKDKYLVIGIGEGSLDGILQRAGGEQPTWLTALRKQLPVQRPATVTYINIKQIIQQFAPLGGPKVQMLIDAAGLGNVTTLAAVSGLDGEGMLNRTFIRLDGEPTGVLSVATGKPLALKDLAPIPSDANLAVAGRLDLARLTDALLAIMEKVEPQAAQEIDRNLKELNDQVGIDLRKDIIGSLGDVWCAYNSPNEGGLLITGLTAVVQVKDYDRLAAAHAKLLARAKAALGQDSRPPREKAVGPKTAEQQELEEEKRAFNRPTEWRTARIEQLRFAGQDIYFLSSGLPFGPAWCLTRTELIVAAYPQQIKAYLSREADFKSLATLPAVADAFSGGEEPLSLAYFQPRAILDYLYPMICLGVQTASQDFARQGMDLNVSVIPSAPAIYKHLRPSVSVMRRTDAGIEFTSRGTIPGSSLTSAAPMALGLMLPAVSSARQAGRRAQSMNNLKQIALAMHNYASVYRHFPPAYIADKKTGKPLLSWRVAILPYIEEDALYKQIHLDEPWDSEHNKKFADMLIAVYRSPASTAKPGMTNYLTVRGKDTAFPGKEGMRLEDITDGTSHTIMAVEANDAKAVPWTKPDDLQYDEKSPAAGLGGLFPGGFNAAFCDGSVRFISNTIDAETLRRLFNRHDGKPLDPGKY